MRTRAQRIDARTDVMEGVDDRDSTICQAIIELCATIDDAAERIADAAERIVEARLSVGAS